MYPISWMLSYLAGLYNFFFRVFVVDDVVCTGLFLSLIRTGLLFVQFFTYVFLTLRF